MSVSVESLLQALYQRRNRGVKLGLDRVRQLLADLGDPQLAFPAVHIAGTNGKGAVASLLAAVYAAAGYRVGLFTSPHLVRFFERIRINGQMLSPSAFVTLMEHILPIADRYQATFFEITTALAFAYFAHQQVDVAIVEVGMGGRLDATNLLRPVLTVVTTIALDHTRELGSSREQIAREKAGIFKAHIPALVADSDLASVFQAIAAPLQVPLHFLAREAQWTALQRLPTGQQFRYTSEDSGPKTLFLPLLGAHQLQNAALAIRAVELLHPRFPVDEDALVRGLKRLYEYSGYAARLEVLRKEPPLILDTAHNPQGIAATVEALRTHFPAAQRWKVAFTAMRTKNWEQMMRRLASIAEHFYFTAVPEERALNPHILAQAVQRLPATVVPRVEMLVELLAQQPTPVLITGSFYLAGAVLKAGLRPAVMENRGIPAPQCGIVP